MNKPDNQVYSLRETLLYWKRFQPNKQVGVCDIYEFSSNSWRVVNAPNCFTICIRYRGVTFKGNTYWISKDNNKYDNYLLSFDFTRERFVRMCLSQVPYSGDHMALSAVREEELSVLIRSTGSSVVEAAPIVSETATIFEDSSSQMSRWRTIVQDVLWTTSRGRGNGGGRGRGGRSQIDF
ncbi:hypothetical protein EUTSA_v10022145mg [Eutrema salsugineum]|uniref:F-box associated beta-propeller type 1 domain-containing protein n=1 Tax=Eutrema salsugineum TaxID=72664 RepID=V4LUX3_EUTSA|nr:hypothetical protein EUTSA_v10022145mg [Eutrema salsugineum]